MASRKSQDIRDALLSKGFKYRESDHTYLVLCADGKQTSIRTKVSHGIREYGDDLLAQVSRQVGLTKAQLLQLVDCPMTHERYVEILVASRRVELR
jgi:tRNA/tmRNA/rRNA uracil-C5-methylase (TrmA/RlmC/RlmD family)